MDKYGHITRGKGCIMYDEIPLPEPPPAHPLLRWLRKMHEEHIYREHVHMDTESPHPGSGAVDITSPHKRTLQEVSEAFTANRPQENVWFERWVGQNHKVKALEDALEERDEEIQRQERLLERAAKRLQEQEEELKRLYDKYKEQSRKLNEAVHALEKLHRWVTPCTLQETLSRVRP